MTAPRNDGPTRVFIHVGAPKTGTTYLQQRLFQNRAALAEDGVLLPYEVFADAFRSSLDFCGTGWAGAPAERYRGQWEAVAQRVRDWHGRTSIVSNELLGKATQPRIAAGLKLLGHAEIHVVFTARDVARQLVSDWQEHVKHKHTVTLETFVDDLVEHGIDAPAPFGEMFWGLHDAARVLGTWGEFVPADRVHVITLPQPGAPKDTLWQRFCSVVGLEPDRYDDLGVRTNTSMGVVETELVRRMNRRIRRMRQNDYDRLVRRLMAERILGSRSNRLTLPPGHLDWSLRWSESLIATLGERGYDVVGDLSELMPRPEDHAEHVSPTGLTDAELAPAAMRAATGMLRQAARQRHTIFELRAQLGDDVQTPPTRDDPDRGPSGRLSDRLRRAWERLRHR